MHTDSLKPLIVSFVLQDISLYNPDSSLLCECRDSSSAENGAKSHGSPVP